MASMPATLTKPTYRKHTLHQQNFCRCTLKVVCPLHSSSRNILVILSSPWSGRWIKTSLCLPDRDLPSCYYRHYCVKLHLNNSVQLPEPSKSSRDRLFCCSKNGSYIHGSSTNYSWMHRKVDLDGRMKIWRRRMRWSGSSERRELRNQVSCPFYVPTLFTISLYICSIRSWKFSPG